MTNSRDNKTGRKLETGCNSKKYTRRHGFKNKTGNTEKQTIAIFVVPFFCLLKLFSLFEHKYSYSRHTDKNKHGLSSESTGGRKRSLTTWLYFLQVFAVVYLCEIFSFQLCFMCLQSVFKALSTTILFCSWTHSISVKSGIFIYEPSKILSRYFCSRPVVCTMYHLCGCRETNINF